MHVRKRILVSKKHSQKNKLRGLTKKIFFINLTSVWRDCYKDKFRLFHIRS